MRINTWTLSLRLQSNLLHLPDVSCQDIKLIFLDFWQNKLFPFFTSEVLTDTFSLFMVFFHTRLPWWKIWISNCKSFFLFKRLTTHRSQQRNIKKSFQSAKFHAFSLLKIELMFHTILLLFFLIRARWKILSWIFLYALLISLWFSSFLLFVFPFFLSLTHI